jgi:hypothetical protein
MTERAGQVSSAGVARAAGRGRSGWPGRRFARLAAIGLACGLVFATAAAARADTPAPDGDGDGVPDCVGGETAGCDRCPGTSKGTAVCPDGCGVEQKCPCDGPQADVRWAHHGEYIRCVSRQLRCLPQDARWGTLRTETLTKATRSRCGARVVRCCDAAGSCTLGSPRDCRLGGGRPAGTGSCEPNPCRPGGPPPGVGAPGD